MDLSKLPKLSDTKSQTAPPVNQAESPAAAPHRAAVAMPRQQSLGVDIWISLVIGILLMMLGANFAHWAIAMIRHQPFHTGVVWPDQAPYNGREATYFELTGFTALSDMGIFLFGVMLLGEAAAKTLLAIKPGVVSRAFLMFAALLTLGTTLLNIFVCYKLFNFGITPLLSGLAVAFGGWILFDEWTTLNTFPADKHN